MRTHRKVIQSIDCPDLYRATIILSIAVPLDYITCEAVISITMAAPADIWRLIFLMVTLTL
jgi:hypothetical protein